MCKECGIGLPKRSPRKRKYLHKTENLEDMGELKKTIYNIAIK